MEPSASAPLSVMSSAIERDFFDRGQRLQRLDSLVGNGRIVEPDRSQRLDLAEDGDAGVGGACADEVQPLEVRQALQCARPLSVNRPWFKFSSRSVVSFASFASPASLISTPRSSSEVRRGSFVEMIQRIVGKVGIADDQLLDAGETGDLGEACVGNAAGVEIELAQLGQWMREPPGPTRPPASLPGSAGAI